MKLRLLFLSGLFFTSNAIASSFASTFEQAEKGDVAAQYELGKMYFDGDRIEQDHRKALAWFRKAGLQGHVDAQYHLGVLYGKGEMKDHREALMWYREAAGQNHPLASGCVASGFKGCL